LSLDTLHASFVILLSGSEDCLVGDRDVVNLGGVAAEGSRSCIVIKPTTKTVPVLIGLPKGAIRENWGVVRSGDKALLQRPDGSYVEYAN
jgi:cyanophycinase-like exopeptidase